MKNPKSRARPSQKRKPATAEKPTKQRRPIPKPSDGSSDHPIVWRFGMLDLDGPWGWSNLAIAFAKQLCEKCCGWESMRENELFGHGGNKRIPAENMCSDAQKRLTELDLDDHGYLWELRLSGEPRVWGLRSGHVFYPIWWDPEHSVCKSKKKHT